MKTVREFINGVLEAGNWDIRDAFDDIVARDAEWRSRAAGMEAEREILRKAVADAQQVESTALAELSKVRERLATVADEAFGPFPVQTAEESLTAIERGIFEMRRSREDERLVRYQAAMVDGARVRLRALVDRTDDEKRELLPRLEALSARLCQTVPFIIGEVQQAGLTLVVLDETPAVPGGETR